jgi:hypothetical protein
VASSKRASERQQFWLSHQRAQLASGQSTKAYAAAHGLSASGFYAARKRLRAQGVLEPSGRAPRRRRPVNEPDVSFTRVAVAPSTTPMHFQLELPGGLVLGWSGAEIPASVVELIDRWRTAP